MLQITISPPECWDEEKEIFVSIKPQTLKLEHSLVSISKWESKWCKPFLGRDAKTAEEAIDYVKCMTLTQNVNPEIYLYLSSDDMKKIDDYINAPMTATTFSKDSNNGSNREVITSELIYFWLINSNIPFECQKWHLNRLLTLIKVCNIKSQPPKKRSARDIMSQNAALNAARRKQFNTKG